MHRRKVQRGARNSISVIQGVTGPALGSSVDNGQVVKAQRDLIFKR